ncbi:LysR family transcriptional regulator [Duganella sp. FT80W]|uniref:LysR family transcriptional regulator n=1 Tax=Duganella guangzhouensis TaxID=2666084 RepID=A0A6I2KZI1_9BURK|nr:LysR family transcriptional regulator [Duganella guangzhouensis]MRW91338.1 LysR family transcriptional regulator [Duganella guangzhouensis]
MKMPDINLLVAFDILLEEGSVVGAAQRMHLSTPAMSRTLARLRLAIGDPVLVRAGRGLAPTPRALALREQVRSVIEQAHAVFYTGREVELATLERTFSIRANDVFINAYSGALRTAFRQHAPNAVLRFVPEGDMEDGALQEGRIDLYISSMRDFGADIKVQELFENSFIGLAREDHPIFDAPVDAERLVQFDHISVSRKGRAYGPAAKLLAELKLEQHVALIVPSFHSAVFALADTDLVAPLIPRSMLHSIQRLGMRVRHFEFPLPLTTVKVVQAWHPRLDSDPAHRWLRQTIKQACQQDQRAV